MQFDAALIYGALAATAILTHLIRRRHRENAGRAAHEASTQSGLNEPASLHPVIDPTKCIGSGACAKACPEDALGIVNGRAELVNAAACIGHGACFSACPVDAISLVFGTERRGMDIPNVSPRFETNVPGIFIAGELGGMGLIRKSAEQGRQAIEAIRSRRADRDELDVVIVGAGPAGFSAGLSAMQHKLRFRMIEQEDSLGGAVYHYPRNKVAMTAPVKLALVGTVKMREVTKEKLLEFWNNVVDKTGLPIHFHERMDRVERLGEGFIVHTNSGAYRTRSVLLAIGRRGTPRKLNVPGEELPKVVYRLIDAEQYRHCHVLVVGGGDSALEAAISISNEPGTTVILSYRGEVFNRVKGKNREALETAVAAGRIELLMNSTVTRITETDVELNTLAGMTTRPNAAVIVCAGGVLPIPLLQQIGIEFKTKYGTR